MAAQIFATAEKALPNLRDQIRNGDFKPLKEWLGTNIHEVGSLYASPDELLTVVTNKPLDPLVYVKYLENKYKAIYKL